MRILIISNLYPPYHLGGAELLCQQVVERLAGKGHQIEVLTSTFRTTISKGEVNGIRVLRLLKLQRSFDLAPSTSRLRRIVPDRANALVTEQVLRELSPDLVFAWSQRRLGVAPVGTCRTVGIPMASILNNDDPCFYMPRRFAWQNPKAWFRYVADRTVFRRHTTLEWDFRFVTCISDCLKEQLLEQGVPIKCAKVIHQGIPLEDFPPKDRLGELNRPLRALYVGQLLESKGVHTLVEAYSHVASALGESQIQLTLVGDGPDEYKRYLRSLVPINSPVSFLGKMPHAQLPEIYREHHIFVFPSIVKEGFGLTFLEAMASGTTVISTTSGGQRECLRDGKNALTFTAGDSRHLAKCILHLISTPELSERLASEARRMAEQDYSLDKYVDRLEDFLIESYERAGLAE